MAKEFSLGKEWQDKAKINVVDTAIQQDAAKPAPFVRKLTPIWNEPATNPLTQESRTLSLDEIKDLLAEDSPANDSSQDSIAKQKSHMSGSLTSVEVSTEMLDKKSDTYPPKVKMLVPKPPPAEVATSIGISALPPLPTLKHPVPVSIDYDDDDFGDNITEEDDGDLAESENSQDF